MSSLIGGIIGAVIGFVVSGGNPYAAQLGFTIGAGVGASFETLPDQLGPRLDDLKTQASEYGRAIPIVYGKFGLSGNMIWASDIVEVRTEEEVGGKGGPSQTQVTFTYFGNFAVALCEGPAKVLRIWAGPDKRLIWDGVNIEGGALRVYGGGPDQMPDPLIEQYLGAGSVPAYRGTCYVVFENFPLKNDGNRLPFLTVEVEGLRLGPLRYTPDPSYMGFAAPLGTYNEAFWCEDPVKHHIWTVSESSGLIQVRANEHSGVGWAFDIPDTNINVAGIRYEPSRAAEIVDSGSIFDLALQLLDLPPIPSRVVVYGNKGDRDWHISFEPDTMTNQGEVLGSSNGLQSIEAELYDPATNKSLVFRGYGYMSVGTESYSGSSAIYMGAYAGHLGYTWLGAVLSAGDYFALFYYGSTDVLIIRRWSDYSLVQSIPFSGITDQAEVAYDPYNKRIIALGGDLNYRLINPVTGVVQNQALRKPDGSLIPGFNPQPTTVTVAKEAYLFAYEAVPQSATTVAEIEVWRLLIVDPLTLQSQRYFSYEGWIGRNMVPAMLTPQDEMATYIYVYDQLYVKRVFYRTEPNAVASVVADLSKLAGLAESQYEVEALRELIDGYAISRQTTVRNAIDAMRSVYYFDAVESNAVMKYVVRGGPVVAEIEDDDLAAHISGQDVPDAVMTTRMMEMELPQRVNVKYLLAATNYSIATKQAARLVGNSGDEKTIDAPLVLTDKKAREVAEVNLHVTWVQRLMYEFTLAHKYAYLEPTDVVLVKGKSMRILKISRTPAGVYRVAAVEDDANYYSPNVLVDETPNSGNVVAQPGYTLLELM